MYATYQATYQDGVVKFLDPIRFKKARLMITVFPENETDISFQQLSEDEITKEMLKKSKKILQKDERLLYNI